VTRHLQGAGEAPPAARDATSMGSPRAARARSAGVLRSIFVSGQTGQPSAFSRLRQAFCGRYTSVDDCYTYTCVSLCRHIARTRTKKAHRINIRGRPEVRNGSEYAQSCWFGGAAVRLIGRSQLRGNIRLGIMAGVRRWEYCMGVWTALRREVLSLGHRDRDASHIRRA
jgi:hypothetical protein